jgi:ribosomal protein S2
MKRVPEVIFVVDGAYEAQALREAKSLKLKAFGILNTNGDTDMVDGFIPANTNSVKSIDYIAGELKSVLFGIKVATKPRNAIRKTEDKKTGVKKAPAKKVEAKKEEK